MNARLTFIHALSPLHAGTGQGTGVIDLPIAREKATGLPFLPGSSLKGTLKAFCSLENVANCDKVFGLDTKDRPADENYASSAQFSDQHLLLLPIRSLAGTFAWVTSPYILRRLTRDIQDAKVKPPTTTIPNIPNTESCFIATDTSKIKIGSASSSTVYLEDLDLKAQVDSGTAEWGKWIGKRVFPNDTSWQQVLLERICIVHDDVFTFMIDTATEITARIKLQEESKTVQDGGLWYEEALPTETILSGIALATPTKVAEISEDEVFAVLNNLTGKTLQFGGKATVGRGMCRWQLTAKEGA